MAAPTSPDITSVTTEGLKKAGYSSPTSAQLTRAQTYWLREIKNDIFMRLRNFKPMQKTAFLPTTIGKHRYANPSDFGSELNLTLMTGAHTGTAQAGAVGSITLASDEDISEDFILGQYILVTSGTGAGSCSQVTAYSTSTKIATVTPNFETAPAASSGYMVVDYYTNLKQKPVWELDENSTPTVRGVPTHYLPIGDSDDGEFILYPPPDKVYGLQMRYYADVMNLDLASTLMTSLYQRWENIWIQGVFVKALQDMDDSRYQFERQVYLGLMNDLVMREQYGVDLSNLTIKVGDYC